MKIIIQIENFDENINIPQITKKIWAMGNYIKNEKKVFNIDNLLTNITRILLLIYVL